MPFWVVTGFFVALLLRMTRINQRIPKFSGRLTDRFLQAAKSQAGGEQGESAKTEMANQKVQQLQTQLQQLQTQLMQAMKNSAE